jgi:molybdenum cofactor cytidylyltransferase
LNNDITIGIIILAAGSSSRMGQSKQLMKIGQQPLLAKAVETALDTGLKKIAVVLGANAEAHKKIIEQYPVDIVKNSGWSAGIGSSLKAGVDHLINAMSSIDRVIIMVCDQPLLTSKHLKALIEEQAKSEKHIVASAYGDTLGTPALFDKKYFGQLLSLNDEDGAKKIIQTNNDDVSSIPFSQGQIDLDTPEDFRSFTKNR